MERGHAHIVINSAWAGGKMLSMEIMEGSPLGQAHTSTSSKAEQANGSKTRNASLGTLVGP